MATIQLHWTPTAKPGWLRAYTKNGDSLWLTPTGGGFIVSRGRTVFESETIGTQEKIEAEAVRLGLLSPETK